MNKKIVKIGYKILIIAFMISCIASNVLALTPNGVVRDDSVAGSDTLETVGGRLVGILQTVGVVLSVVILIVLGIKYMMGSAEEKSEYKKSMMPYIIGAALIFAASMLAQVIYRIL